MFRYGNLHITGHRTASDGRLLALTVYKRTDHGVYVVAGRLHQTSEAKSASDIQPDDYFVSERVSLSTWQQALKYFNGTPFEPLITALDERIAGFDRPTIV